MRVSQRPALLIVLVILCRGVSLTADCHVSMAGNRAVLAYRLDPKTEVAFEDRDRTNTSYFHGWAVLEKGNVGQELASAIISAMAQGTCREELVPTFDRGVRFFRGTANTDVLLCLRACASPYLMVPGTRQVLTIQSTTASELERLFAQKSAP